MAGLRIFYGGTFDPVHEGHLAIARAARASFGEPVHVMPAADPPHRPPPGASAHHRVAMLELALVGEPGLLLDLRELHRDGPSYSVDTLHALRAEFGADAPLALLVGADSFLGLPTWHRWQELFGLAHFIVAGRPGSLLETAPAELRAAADGRWTEDPAALRAAPAGALLHLHQSLHVHSATAVRRLIGEGRAWQHLLPPAVAGYVQAHGLYGAAGADR
ncbi:MAG TPA: nicotinate-nucleotide adenylyltransferase [Xanthomonadaceae bacterium]|nr:nicotinate-nucleotide adenylyltransferase [Xanthomonadaceae bacterium]